MTSLIKLKNDGFYIESTAKVYNIIRDSSPDNTLASRTESSLRNSYQRWLKNYIEIAEKRITLQHNMIFKK